MNELVLEGCTPEPLMGYLKALGVLRLVSEQADTEARGSWRDGMFVLETSLDGGELAKFFREKYKPTPIIVPWSGSDFFGVNIEQLSGPYAATPTGSRIVEAFSSVKGQRFASYGEVIRASLCAMQSLGLVKKEQLEKAAGAKMKARFLARLRSWLPDSLVGWVDVAVQLTESEFTPNVLLGSGGGNDGNTHFSDNFMQNLWDVLPDFDDQRGIEVGFSGKVWALRAPPEPVPSRLSVSKLKGGGFKVTTNLTANELLARLKEANPGDDIQSREIERRLHRANAKALEVDVISAALFGIPTRALLEGRTSALFNSGGVGGPNAGVGLERDALLNPWDFILAIEGAISLAGAVSKRQGTQAGRAPVFPFSVRMTATGFGSGSDQENGQNEIWLPLWNRLAGYAELQMLFSNSRCEIGRRPARTGLDFARAVASVGVDAGIPVFARFGIVKGRVGGDNYNTAVSAGLFQVKARPHIGLIDEVDRWLESFEYATAASEVPTRFKTARRRIESSLFDLCRYSTNSSDATWFQAVLTALGSAERELSVGGFARQKIRGGRSRLSPIQGLSSRWLSEADDGSSEYRLARSIAFMNPGTKGIGRIRRNLEPVELKGASWSWGEDGGHVVWNGGDLARNLGAVVVRRLMESEKQGEPLPPLDSPFPVSLTDIAAFLHGEIDETKLGDLLWGLSLVECGKERDIPNSSLEMSVPRAYAILKLTLLPGHLEWVRSQGGDAVLRLNRPNAGNAPVGTVVKSEPAIPAKLRAGNVQGACEIAARRLRASGLEPLRGFLPEMNYHEVDATFGGVAAQRLLGALLFPIPNYAVPQLADLVLRRPELETLV